LEENTILDYFRTIFCQQKSGPELKSRTPILAQNLRVLIRRKSGPDFGNSAPDLVSPTQQIKTVFLTILYFELGLGVNMKDVGMYVSFPMALISPP
jgi:hypothetical protein